MAYVQGVADELEDLEEPLSPVEAKQLIRKIIQTGKVELSAHARDEMKDDELGEVTIVDAVNVLRGGVVQPGELEKGTYRYQVRTTRMSVIVAFRSRAHLVIVTAWRTTP